MNNSHKVPEPYSVVISDLHLSEHRPHTLELLEQFLETHQGKAEKLFILGDLVEMWIGDDDHSHLNQKITHLLQKCGQQHTQVYFMAGNRDFLIGRTFARRCNLTMLPDPCKITLYGHDILFSHGDLLCTSDERYQRYRHIVQKHWIQKLFKRLPLHWRRRLANKVRQDSQKQSQRNQSRPEIVDVTEDAVKAWLDQYSVDHLIHGHTHRFGTHDYGDQSRIVLGDWDTAGSYIYLSEKKVELCKFEPEKR